MLVTFWTANWTANSSLRCSGSLCSVRNGAVTTPKAWNPMDHRAAARITTGSAGLASSATTATIPAASPAPNTSRRPTRSEAALAGNATSAPASDPTVDTSPTVDGENPRATR